MTILGIFFLILMCAIALLNAFDPSLQQKEDARTYALIYQALRDKWQRDPASFDQHQIEWNDRNYPGWRI